MGGWCAIEGRGSITIGPLLRSTSVDLCSSYMTHFGGRTKIAGIYEVRDSLTADGLGQSWILLRVLIVRVMYPGLQDFQCDEANVQGEARRSSTGLGYGPIATGTGHSQGQPCCFWTTSFCVRQELAHIPVIGILWSSVRWHN